jgi:hypothetical protein
LLVLHHRQPCASFPPGRARRDAQLPGLFGGQYILQYAVPGAGEPRPEERDLDEVIALAEAFPAKVAEVRGYWRDRIAEARRLGQRVAVWGGGSKCVSFLGALGVGDEVGAVVDINPFKQGKFVPGTAHEVLAPEDLVAAPPDLVIAMNALYEDEIRASLANMGLGAEVVAV